MTLFAVARILKSTGLKGFVKVQALTHSTERFENLREVYVGKDDRDTRRMAVNAVKVARNGVQLKFGTIDDRTASDALVGHFVFVDEANVLFPPRGSYFIHDIIGCRVLSNDNLIGTVIEVYTKSQGMAQDIWVIGAAGDKAKQFWLPAVPDFIERVDIARKVILVRRLDELFNL